MKDIDLSSIDFNNIGDWPLAGKAAVIGVLCVVVLALGYFFDTQGQLEHLERERGREVSLKQDFETKQAKAANLEAYRQQMAEMQESFGAMLRQLPSKTEVEDLLVDISQTGLASGIEFELFKPEAERIIDFYAEQPISIVVLGKYHQFGEFVSGVAALPRIVTLESIDIKHGKDARLTMSMVAKTYRYLDEEEMAAQRQAQQAAAANQKKRKR